ncbi:zinc-dependent alcohol dehydrogenase [Brevibacterium aurantiacum]|uniref:zinc-dependent alcohol dehydrogenase n=1 Tax=Brevibacterium aurantiacum TaxID=273384 RepID=UPI00186712B6|nr:alcohol dehydrogenase catalytic domain-containing protein [Brevibacterium aurantiacum]
MITVSAYEIPEPGRMHLVQRSFPELAPEDLLVRVHRVGVCATDLHLLDGDLGVAYPLIPGHEFVGEIAAIGSAAARRRGLRDGDRVAVEMLLPCHNCDQCRRGRYNLCELDDRSVAAAGRQYGINIPAHTPPGLWGGYSEYVFAPQEALVHWIPDNLSWDRASLVEPLAVAFRAVDRAGVGPGDSVVVIGPGPIGLLTVAAARARGAGTAVITGTRQSRLDVAVRMGADASINVRSVDAFAAVKELLPKGADVVIETAGQASAQEESVHFVRRGGVVVLAGACGSRVPITFHQDEDILLNEIDIRGSFLSAGGFEPAIELLSSSELHFEELITHHYGFADVPLALSHVRDREQGVLKAVINTTTGGSHG